MLAQVIPFIVVFNSVPQGVGGVDNRVGNKLNCYAIVNSIFWTWDSVAIGSAFRIFMFVDTQQVNSTSPTPTEVFGFGAPHLAQLQMPTTYGRFRVLFDRTITQRVVNQQNCSGKMMVIRRITRPWYYVSSAASSITKNGVYMFIWSNEPVGFQPTVRMFTTMYAYDT